MRRLNQITFLALIIISNQAISAVSVTKGPRHDGVMLDENGLTIAVGHKVGVDVSRWNLDKDVYTSSQNPGLKVKVFFDSGENVTGVEKTGFGDESGFYIDNIIFTDESLLITTALCDQVEKQNFFGQVEACKNLEKDFSSMYLKQFTEEENITKISAVVDMPKANVKTSFQKVVKDYKDMMKKQGSSDGPVHPQILNQVYTRCADLKRYSTKVESVPAANRGVVPGSISK